jgi:hypothetical protein
MAFFKNPWHFKCLWIRGKRQCSSSMQVPHHEEVFRSTLRSVRNLSIRWRSVIRSMLLRMLYSGPWTLWVFGSVGSQCTSGRGGSLMLGVFKELVIVSVTLNVQFHTFKIVILRRISCRNSRIQIPNRQRDNTVTKTENTVTNTYNTATNQITQ